MKIKLFIGVAAVVAFFIGLLVGARQPNAPSIVDASAGQGYRGGYDQASDQSLGSVALQGAPDNAVRGNIIEVRAGQSIQAAVKRALPGDTIRVYPGRYSETVYVDKDDIRLLGVIQQGKRATLEGEGKLNDAILYSGNNFVVENFKIVNYKGNAIMGQAGNNFAIRNNVIRNSGVYGIFPQLGKNGLVEHNVVSGIEDAAIYIGMSDNVHVAHNDVFDSVAGIEIENSRHAIVENNYVHNNTGGILAFITPGLPIKTTYDVIIRNNFVVGNNHKNFGAPGSTVAGIPAGTGLLIMAADDVVIEGNIIAGHKTAGILITDHDNASNIGFDPDSDPNPDRIAILDNTLLENGYDTIKEVKALMLAQLSMTEPDIVAVGRGEGSCIINRHRYKTVGIEDYGTCSFTHTDQIATYLLDEPVPARVITAAERGKITYYGVCSGCHSYTGQLIGPSVQSIQALYQGDAKALANYIAQPVKKRKDFPEMPPQDYLGEQTMLAVAQYMLAVTN